MEEFFLIYPLFLPDFNKVSVYQYAMLLKLCSIQFNTNPLADLDPFHADMPT